MPRSRPHPDGSTPSASVPRPIRALVVDDDPEMRRYIRLCLERSSPPGATVRVCADGLEALRAIRDERFDVLITDVRLPGLDGLALCEALERTELNHAIPALLVTGEPEAAARAEAMAGGRRDRALLGKPFNATRLTAALARLLEAT